MGLFEQCVSGLGQMVWLARVKPSSRTCGACVKAFQSPLPSIRLTRTTLGCSQQGPGLPNKIDEIVSREYPDFEIIWFGHIGDGNSAFEHSQTRRPE